MRQTDPAYLRMIRSLPCIAHCGRIPSEAAHVRYSDASVGKPITGIGIKPDDRWALPLCHKCHIHGQHMSAERHWWSGQHIDPIRKCLELHKCYENGRKRGLNDLEIRDAMIVIIGMGWVHG